MTRLDGRRLKLVMMHKKRGHLDDGESRLLVRLYPRKNQDVLANEFSFVRSRGETNIPTTSTVSYVVEVDDII